MSCQQDLAQLQEEKTHDGPHCQPEPEWIQEARSSPVVHGVEGSLSVIRMLSDGEHLVKEGPIDDIVWEFTVYRQAQRRSPIPSVCEAIYKGDGKGYLLLHRVFCFSEIFSDIEANPWLGPFLAREITWSVYSAIRAMRLIHERDIIHHDIHPGNVGLTPCVPLAQLLSPSSSYDFNNFAHWQVVFIDYEWSIIHGWHHDDDFIRTRMWLYASDRQLLGLDDYSAADDLEALAYTLLAVYYTGRLPWRDEIDAESSKFPDDFGDADSDIEFVVETRNKHLRELRSSDSESDSLLADLVEFIFYTRGLHPYDVIDYPRWESLFHKHHMACA